MARVRAEPRGTATAGGLLLLLLLGSCAGARSQASGVLPSLAKDERVSASHLLVAWRGARGADESVTRSRDEALALITALRERAVAGERLDVLAVQFSDSRGARKGRQWTTFDRTAIAPLLSEAAFRLSPGETSPVLETERGYHLVQRRPEGQ